MWNLASGRELHTLTGHEDEVWHVALTDDGSRAVSASQDGILKVDRLRARKTGQSVWIDLEAIVKPDLKVAEVKEIIGRARENIISQFERIGDVMIISRASEPVLKEIVP